METFSEVLKRRNTDEWYTPVEPVEMIVPFLHRGGITRSYARLIRLKAISLKC